MIIMKKILGILVSVCFLALPMIVCAAKDVEKIDITEGKTIEVDEHKKYRTTHHYSDAIQCVVIGDQ